MSATGRSTATATAPAANRSTSCVTTGTATTTCPTTATTTTTTAGAMSVGMTGAMTGMTVAPTDGMIDATTAVMTGATTAVKVMATARTAVDLALERPLQHRVHQDIAARGDVLGLGVFDLVVADAVLAGDEDHPGRRQARHVDGIMAGPRDGLHVGVAQRRRGAADGLHAVGMEGRGGVVRDQFDLDLQT